MDPNTSGGYVDVFLVKVFSRTRNLYRRFTCRAISYYIISYHCIVETQFYKVIVTFIQSFIHIYILRVQGHGIPLGARFTCGSLIKGLIGFMPLQIYKCKDIPLQFTYS